MLAVAAQLPAAMLADEASGAAAIATIAQIADAAAFVLTMRPPLLAPMNEASVGAKGRACPYKTLKSSRTDEAGYVAISRDAPSGAASRLPSR